jgi:transposase
MRFIKLTDAEVVTLQEGHKNHHQFQFRNRCHCLLLSNQGITVTQIAQFFEVSKITVYAWFDAWQRKGLTGLLNKPGRGRKPILSLQNSNHIQSVKKAIARNPQSVKTVVAELETALNEKMSRQTVRRFLKNLVIDSIESAPRSGQGRWMLSEAKKKRH